MNCFSKNLKQALVENEISQVELANMIGKNKSSVSNYLSGKNIPKEDVQEKIAEILNVSVEWLNSENEEKEDDDIYLKNITIEQAAKMMNKSREFVRMGLINGTAPFGFAVKMSSKWSFHISPKKFYEYMEEENGKLRNA